MAEFAYNNMKNASTSYIFFEFNYSYHLQTSYKKDINPWSKSKSINKLATKLKKLIIYRENLLHASKLQK